MLSYYIAQYLVAAVFGKVSHSYRAAEVVNYIWTEIGLILVFLHMIRILQVKTTRMQLLAVLLLCFFSGPLLLGQKMLELVYPLEDSMANSYHWFSFQNGILLQYSSNYTMLRWVFPQVIVIWLIALLFIEHKEKIEDYVALMLPALLFGTFSFVGMLPIGFAMVLIYGMCLFVENKRNPLFYIVVGELMIIPFFKMGLYNDFVMRCSIPCLFIMLIMIVDYLNKATVIGFGKMSALHKLCITCLIVTVLIGFIYPFKEFSDSIIEDDILKLGDKAEVLSLEAFANRYAADIPDDYKYNYYSYDIDENAFYKYIARVKWKMLAVKIKLMILSLKIETEDHISIQGINYRA